MFNVTDDLKDLGSFQFVPGDACVWVLCALIFLVCVFPDLARPAWAIFR